ncbi:tRNA (adenosine(37)-N6)-threonylcarbamoyltransferase complex transferase subunit TsaD [Candidatus Peregrinibacteria bacterium]|nr:tRNA (adenosine(37)-N6)-threonylcarbamoyltransferase complex transferase subunit TsaD [Candidatus Peregrinibacteria bacterium]
MRVLGIETSCDETAASVVENGTKVLSNVIASQIDLHKKTGGVVPEVAAREHILKIIPVIKETLEQGGCEWKDIDGIAAVPGPGLISALLTGTLTASTLALVKEKPLIPVHHILGHIYGNWCGREKEKFEFPILILTVSGGHNDLILMKNHGEFELIGQSRDDAAGEAFDKVAKLLGLGYPGGPAIQKAALEGNKNAFDFPKAKLGSNSNGNSEIFDYSFSGLKTAVLYAVQEKYGKDYLPEKLNRKFVCDTAASFQKTVVDTLIDRLENAADKYNPKEIHIAGGVSANLALREEAKTRLVKFNVPIKYPVDISYCTDNAAMIASCGYFLFNKDPNKYKNWQNIQPSADFTF